VNLRGGESERDHRAVIERMPDPSPMSRTTLPDVTNWRMAYQLHIHSIRTE
jgi:hypothetical protein